MTPTLVKLEPEPKQIVISNLSDDSAVLNAIGGVRDQFPRIFLKGDEKARLIEVRGTIHQRLEREYRLSRTGV